MSAAQAAALAAGGNTLAQSYVMGGGNGGTDNVLGDPTDGMVPALGLRVADGSALDVTNPNDVTYGSLGIVGGIFTLFAATGTTGSEAGKDVFVQAGDAASGGVDADGGDVELIPGSGNGAGSHGVVRSFSVVIDDFSPTGAPQIYNPHADSPISLSGDGIGPIFGGTAVYLENLSAAQQSSRALLAVNDVAELTCKSGSANVNLLGVAVGTALVVSANRIVPVKGISHVGAGLIKNITVPNASDFPFRGSITLIPDVAFTYDNTGNIVVASGSGTAIVNRPMIATYDGTKWYMSY